MRKLINPVEIRANILSAAVAILMVAVLLLSSIELMTCTFGDQWFRHEFEKYSVLEDVRGEMTMDAATGVMSEIMDYLMGRSDNINVYAEVDGRNLPFMTLGVQQHMTDCRGIVDKLKVFRIIAVIVIVGLVIYLRRTKSLRLKGIFLGVGGVALLTMAAVTLVGGFSEAFVIFHHIAFDNDLWLIDPRIDNLINLLPEGFFMDTCAVSSIVSLCVTVKLFVVLKHI